ncbi:hypothetical protein FNV43_RR13835 [Rhamnella rubrinervis]|uniref:Pentatricopeptide repeat-containing protein n=1 Tax=Rhamnella rubrinervis TaxID=2594499 RepID=A0A8K0H1X6_9ROSA|nr:hypothetical protein FNV43_RR13835 [Rhamnella rubrinervis]
MKLHCVSKLVQFPVQTHHCNSRVLTSLFSTKTPSRPSSSSSSFFSDSLFNRLRVIRDPKASILPVLQQWVNEKRPLDRRELRYLVRIMKDFRRYNHALEISHWMTDNRYFDMLPSDAAIRLELIHIVHGIEKAENYFNNISNKLRTYNAYGALLHSYVRENSVDKAEAIMHEMRKMGLAKSSFAYNILINLYSQNGQHDKIDNLMREMENDGITYDKYTLRNRMAAYVAASNILGMEKILNRMENDPCIMIDWKVYSVAANGYLKAGSIKKAFVMLQKMEELMPYERRKAALEYLLSLYASTGRKEELYRVWNTYKTSNDVMDRPYSCMITSLAKLDDIEGAEKIFEEWESECTTYDFRVLNRLLVAYCKEGLLEKAESLAMKTAEGRTPYASTWNVLAIGYLENKQMPKAVEMLKKALSVGRKGWMPNRVTLEACLDYLKGQGDSKGMEEIIGLLKELGSFDEDIYEKLLT